MQQISLPLHFMRLLPGIAASGFWQGAGFVAAYNKQSLVEGRGVPGHLALGGSRGGRAAPCTRREGLNGALVPFC